MSGTKVSTLLGFFIAPLKFGHRQTGGRKAAKTQRLLGFSIHDELR
jgi:hypothetical protein